MPSDILSGAAPKWQARDDVYQVGQLLGMLVKGSAAARIRTGEVRGLRCTDHLKEIVYRCIGERRKRYESAAELIDALTHPPAALKVGRLRTLKGAHVAFTGILSRPRIEAARAARTGRSESPRRAFREDDRRRPGQAEPAPGRRQGRGKEAARDQAAAREGPPDHALERDAVLAAGGTQENFLIA